MSKTWFTADTHFGHANIIRFCNRPWQSVEEHDRGLIELWNSVVAPGDTVFHLGDFAYKMHPREMLKVFGSLHGTKHLIRGNHDNSATEALPWASVSERLVTSVSNQRLVLDHYPLRSWNGSNRGTISLFGHVHNRIENYFNSCDVGVDAWDYMPVDLASILRRLAEVPAAQNDASDELGNDPPPGPTL